MNAENARLQEAGEQKAAWKKALVPVHKENESRVGKETLEAVYKQTGFKP